MYGKERPELIDVSCLKRNLPGNIIDEVFRVENGIRVILTGRSGSETLWKTERTIRTSGQRLHCASTFVAHELRRRGIGSTIMDNSIRFASSLGLEQLTGMPIAMGKYAWVRKGFHPSSDAWRSTLRPSFKKSLEIYAGKISKRELDFAHEIIDHPDPETISYLPELKELVEFSDGHEGVTHRMNLGCALLVGGPVWFGVKEIRKGGTPK